MNELDELVARPCVLTAGRFGPDGRVAEHKTADLYIENPALAGITQWFCAAVTTMSDSMAHAVARPPRSPNWPTKPTPYASWTRSARRPLRPCAPTTPSI
jgi:roadblock/LC7 domain-containing protein